MSSFVKLVAVLSAGLLAAVAAADTRTADDKSKKTDSTSAPKEKGKKDKKKDSAKPVEDPDAPLKPIQVPIPNGHDAKVLTIPYRDTDGKLKMRFSIGVATKVDENHMDMENTQVETFNDDGEHEMFIDLPKSTLELATWDVTAHQAVKIKREDFDITGNEMIFNLKTKVGGLGGDVRMTIYNLQDSTRPAADGAKPAGGAPAADKPSVSPAPAAAVSPASPEPKAK